jgi:hypothetical protein
MSPIPNGGFMFEVHQDDILVIEGAKFNDNLNYKFYKTRQTKVNNLCP